MTYAISLTCSQETTQETRFYEPCCIRNNETEFHSTLICVKNRGLLANIRDLLYVVHVYLHDKVNNFGRKMQIVDKRTGQTDK